MWNDFDFNEPYDGELDNVIFGVELPEEYVEFMRLHNGGEGDTGHIIIGSNGGGEMFGLNSGGKYFIVPELIEEEYLEVIGESIENLPADINKYWEEN